MVRTSSLPCAGLLAVLLVAPQAHATDTYVGPICGYQPVPDKLGLFGPPAESWIAELDAGPFVVLNTSTISVTITCTLQIGTNNAAVGGITRSSTTPGNVGVLSHVVHYRKAATARVYICTRIDWLTPDGAQQYVEDTNLEEPGVQCRG